MAKRKRGNDMSVWATIDGSMKLETFGKVNELDIEGCLLMLVEAKKFLGGSEGGLTISFMKEKVERRTFTSSYNFFERTTDYEPPTNIVGIHLSGNLRDWNNSLDDTLEFLASVVEDLNEVEAITVEAASFTVSSCIYGGDVGFVAYCEGMSEAQTYVGNISGKEGKQK